MRKTVHITEIQAWMLKQRAKELGVSESELVRRGLDIVLEAGSHSKEVRERAKLAIGLFSSGDTDVAQRHDEYLAEAYSHEHSR